jgi:8-oxo-dGTP pyrophosphatase MutT (NUDIX family)
MEEQNEVIDREGNTIAIVSRKEIKEKKLRHKAAFIIVKNSKNQYFIAQRSHTKKTYPLKWSFGAGGAVMAGESFDNAAKRELEEELGIKEKVEYLFDFPFDSEEIHYLAKVYETIFNKEVIIEKREYEQGKWASVEEIFNMNKKGDFCPDSILYFEKYLAIKK